MAEFDLIRTHFADLGAPRSDVLLGVGDDCALLAVPPGQVLAVSIDTLNAGVHFFPDCDPEALGHKALAVGLSDLAAMGAEPAWATLAIALPAELARECAGAPREGAEDETAPRGGWLAAFARGFHRLARDHGVRLVGGDMTRGPLSLTVQVHGLVPAGAALRRDRARPGDLVCVSGSLGDAGLALRELLAGRAPQPGPRGRLERPAPRVALGLALRGIARAAIDISDGLAADLGHILAASGVGAELDLDRLPLSPPVAEAVRAEGRWDLPLASGDDYELCFCLPPERAGDLAGLALGAGVPVTAVGRILAGTGLVCRGPDGARATLAARGFDHFAEP